MFMQKLLAIFIKKDLSIYPPYVKMIPSPHLTAAQYEIWRYKYVSPMGQRVSEQQDAAGYGD